MRSRKLFQPAALMALTILGTARSSIAEDIATHSAEAQAPAPGPSAAVKPDEASSYSLGLSFATQWRESGLNELIDQKGLIRGIQAGLASTPVSEEDRQRASTLLHDAYQNFAASNKAAALAFLARNAKEPGVTTTASGLEYQILKKGDATAASPGPNDHVKVQYRGLFENGKEFDSSASRGRPVVIRLNAVIPGWREALSMMKPGAQWRVFVPPELAYGMTPPPAIPPNALLIFEIEVVGVEPGGPPPAARR